MRQSEALRNLFLPTQDLGVLDWENFRPGVEISWIQKSDRNAGGTAFLRYQPGSSIPWHWHPAFEHILVLQGSQSDENGTYPAGTVLVNPPGSSHTVKSDGGCIVLAVWERPVDFSRSSYSVHGFD